MKNEIEDFSDVREVPGWKADNSVNVVIAAFLLIAMIGLVVAAFSLASFI